MAYSVQQIDPVFYGMYYYHYVRMSCMKNQYVYRYIYFAEGTGEVCLGEKHMICPKGSVLYLVPGDRYNFLLSSGKFSLINLFFDFFPYHGADRKDAQAHCVFEPDFSPSLCSERIAFADAPALNASGLLDGRGCGELFEDMLRHDRADGYASLYYKASLCALTHRLLQNAPVGQKSRESAAVRKILSYIDANPDKIDSPKMLSAIFCYHENYINRLVKAQTGMTLSGYIKRAKIRYAEHLLADTDMSVSQVAAELGYFDYSHFYKAYKSVTGTAPSHKANR